MNINLSISEMQLLKELLSPEDDGQILSKLTEATDVSRWNSINTLIPLGIKVLVEDFEGRQYFATRYEMADSYSPVYQTVVDELGEVIVLQAGLEKWTRHFD